MANAAAKRTAAQNEQTIRNLKLGMFLSFLLSVVLRLLLRRTFLPSRRVIAIFTATSIPEVLLFRYLVKSGTIRRDPATGTLLSSGEDLSQPGVTEWCFDIVYVTWVCQVGSAVFGEWFWWLYLSIPLYALYKGWSLVSPMIFPKASPVPSEDANENDGKDAVSKRQQKLRKREERGDPRVRAVQGRR